MFGHCLVMHYLECSVISSFAIISTREKCGCFIITDLSLASYLWDIGRQCRSDQNGASGQGLHCLFTDCLLKFKYK